MQGVRSACETIERARRFRRVRGAPSAIDALEARARLRAGNPRPSLEAEGASVRREDTPRELVERLVRTDGDGAAFWADHAPRHPTTTWVLVTGDPGAAERIRQLRSADDVPAFFLLAKPVSMRMLEEFVRKKQGATVATS